MADTERVRARLQVWVVGGAVMLLCAVACARQQAVPGAIAEARQLVEAGKLADAEAELRSVLRHGRAATGGAVTGGAPAEDAAEQAEAQYLLGYVLFREQRPTESLAAYTAGAALRQPTAEELEVVASDYVLLKDFADAAKWLRYATGVSPGEVRAWYLLGRSEYNLDHVADAATAFAQCLRLRPRDIRCEYNLGLSDEKLGRMDEARAAYRAAIAWQADAGAVRDAQPYLDLGMVERKAGETTAAVGHLRTATEISPRNPKGWEELGLALDAAGQTDAAIAALERAAGLAPGAEQPHFFLGRIYRRVGREKDAAAQFKTVETLLGTHSDTSTPNVDPVP